MYRFFLIGIHENLTYNNFADFFSNKITLNFFAEFYHRFIHILIEELIYVDTELYRNCMCEEPLHLITYGGNKNIVICFKILFFFL